ncbi:MAG: SpoIID/LytB domain-containing protein [Nocardioides sp.]|nr:SpoIID/LytB domain-containing protein [Nocardioides sp.]
MSFSRVRSFLLAGALVASAAPVALGGVAAPAAADTTVTIVGNGYGHGHGLSQWGAELQARDGRGTNTILRFYYPGTGRGKIGGKVTVRITADTGNDLVVSPRSHLKVRSLGDGRRWDLDRANARAWRLKPARNGNRTEIAFKTRTRWKVWRTVKGEAEISAGGRPVQLRTEQGGAVRYRGSLRSARPSDRSKRRDTVNVVSLESYLRGVVPREVPASWKPAAVQAQAIAARTYAAYERARPLAPHYQICDTTSCQVYGGADSEHPASDRAIRRTAKKVLLSGGEPAFTQFSASNGGWASQGAFDYLPAQRDRWDTAYRGWRVEIPSADADEAFGVGRLQGVDVLSRDGNGPWGGRATQVRVRGSADTVTMSAEDFRYLLGLRSTLFDVR